MTTQLFHYTCEHGDAGIRKDGGLVVPQASSHGGFAWLTDLDVPLREALGLTSISIDCDRTVHRWRISPEDAAVHAARYVAVRRSLPQSLVAMLEYPKGVMPMHWWVSARPLRATRDY